MPLSRTTVDRILETASPHIQRGYGSGGFTIVCTVEEGIACRFASSDWSDQTLAPLALQIIDELGWGFVEHSARRQVVVRCTMQSSDPGAVRCECDRGDGFQALEIT